MVDETREDWIGRRVARWRDVAGMTQQQLADAVQVSREHLSRIENGHRSVTDRRLLYALATALGVNVGDLTGQPEPPRNRHDLAVYSAVPAMRGALDDDPPDDGPLDPSQMGRRVDAAMRLRMACDYANLANLLPSLIASTRRLANSGGDGAELGLGLFVRTAVCAALAVKPFGYLDLAARFAERATAAADLLDQPVERAAAGFATAQCALASGTTGGQRRSLAVSRTHADLLGGTGDDAALTWWVMLHLHAGLSAATLGDGDTAVAHHREAATTAERISTDPWRMEPAPANVGVWRVSIALEDDPVRVPHYTRRVDRTALRSRQRTAHLHIQAGRGCCAADDPAAAVRHFLAADEVAPSELRSRPSVRELVGQMVRDARGRGSTELRDLATRVGIDPLQPDADLGQRDAELM